MVLGTTHIILYNLYSLALEVIRTKCEDYSFLYLFISSQMKSSNEVKYI